MRASFVLLFLLVGLGACGTHRATGPVCEPGSQSQPGAADDPCPQAGTPCALAGSTNIALCGDEGFWGECVCPGVQHMPPAVCGNGQIDPGEQCDGQNLGGASCASLGAGFGTLLCDSAMCVYDTSMCMLDPGSSGSGGGGAGG